MQDTASLCLYSVVESKSHGQAWFQRGKEIDFSHRDWGEEWLFPKKSPYLTINLNVLGLLWVFAMYKWSKILKPVFREVMWPDMKLEEV